MEWSCAGFGIVSILDPVVGLREVLILNRVAAAEGWFIYKADWNQAVEDAQTRNAAG